MKNALVIGGNGFIGHNLVKRLKSEGWHVTVIDIKDFAYGLNPADEVIIGDARDVLFDPNKYQRIYQLAADMGGAGFVFTGDNDADIITNSLGVNLHVAQLLKEADYKGILFYSSSACAYPDGVSGKEEDAYPANPPHDYGWEKLISERLYQAYARNYGLDIRIARFQNTFGPYGTYEGGREKSPAAICRKVLQATEEIEIWGDGAQVRPFLFVDDLLDGIEALIQSDVKEPINLGPDFGITINDLVDIVSVFDGKKLVKKHVPGPTGGQYRYCDPTRAFALGWRPKTPLEEGFRQTYEWIKEQLAK